MFFSCYYPSGIIDLWRTFSGYPHVYTQLYVHSDWIARGYANTLHPKIVLFLILKIAIIFVSLN